MSHNGVYSAENLVMIQLLQCDLCNGILERYGDDNMKVNAQPVNICGFERLVCESCNKSMQELKDKGFIMGISFLRGDKDGQE